MDFDAETAEKRAAHLIRLLEAHAVPDDRETALVLFIEGITRLVRLFGPNKMAEVGGLFITAWRQIEGYVVVQALTQSVLREVFKHMKPEDETKVH